MESISNSETAIGRNALRKASWRLLPLIFLGYGIAYIDRVNIGFAALEMNEDLRFSATVYGLGGGLFFLSYALCEIPSNLLLVKFGARRWIARIMLTWGAIAVGMMFVKTPLQFYCLRFLLGMAEAGFFPGVLFYLTQWFPVEHRGRAVSHFYVALPLSVAVMGAVAGGLLGLRGQLGLTGWQWLFLVEGTPAVILGIIIWAYLPDSPASAAWLTDDERHWINSRLSADTVARRARMEPRIVTVLRDPSVWRIGICNALILGSNYALTLSVPLLLKGATRWSSNEVGLLMSATAVLGALAMVLNGAHSDWRRERYLHAVLPMTLGVISVLNMGLSGSPAVVVTSYIMSYIAQCATQAAFWLIPSDAMHGRSAAIGLAAIGSIGMLGAFIFPYGWGLVKDLTGSFQTGLLALAVAYSGAAVMLLSIRRSLRGTIAANGRVFAPPKNAP